MHLPILHISTRRPPEEAHDEDPLQLGRIEGRDWIPWLADEKKAWVRAGMRTKTLDAAGLSLAALGSEVTYFSLMASLFSAFSRRTALALSGAIIPTVALNQFVKARFRYPRPPRGSMQKYAFVAPGDFTFPSGHAQNAVALGLFIAQRSKSPWLRYGGVIFAVSVPLSRVYLGVHYPRDVLAGSLLGIGSLAGLNLLEGPFRRWWNRTPRGSRGFLVGLSSIYIGLLSGTPLAAFPLGMGAGLAVGQDISGRARFRLDKPTRERRIVQGAVGLALFIGAGTAMRPILKKESSASAAFAGGVVGLSLTLGMPMAADLLDRLERYARQSKRRSASGLQLRKRFGLWLSGASRRKASSKGRKT
ncbi:phosphatase PAP2 family protein [bacterium]|nr:phosphatase PAP2 family protein [bacterium]